MRSKGKLDECCVWKERNSKENIFLPPLGLCRIPFPFLWKFFVLTLVLTLMARNTTLILLFIISALCISQNGVYAFGAGNIPSSVTLDDSF